MAIPCFVSVAKAAPSRALGSFGDAHVPRMSFRLKRKRHLSDIVLRGRLRRIARSRQGRGKFATAFRQPDGRMQCLP
jgi:hypothetical protein